jgi:hypothetical protein
MNALSRFILPHFRREAIENSVAPGDHFITYSMGRLYADFHGVPVPIWLAKILYAVATLKSTKGWKP